jgi:hypothetical protein
MRIRRRYCCLEVLVLVTVGCVCLLTPGPQRAQALPAGRHYELASPVFKGGFGATKIRAIAPNGQSVAFYSAGTFDGDPGNRPSNAFPPDYLARRSAIEWETTPLLFPLAMSHLAVEDFSPDLSLELASGSPQTSETGLKEEESAWLRSTSSPDVPSAWQATSIFESTGHEIALTYVTASADLCHAYFEKDGGDNNPAKVEPVAEAEGTQSQLYQADRGCHGEPPGITLVGVNNSGTLIDRSCEVRLGAQHLLQPVPGMTQVTGYAYNAVNRDGSDVFFTDCVGGEPGYQLFVRVGGKRTLEVSRPLETAPFGGCVGEGSAIAGEVPCKGAVSRASSIFVGASEDGSKVYFKALLSDSKKPLVPGDEDASDNLYMAEIGCPQADPGCAASEREVTSLSEPSHDPNSGGTAGVEGVLRVSPDGQRVYFVASGDLLSAQEHSALEAEGKPVPQVGAANLYVYDNSAGTGTVSFVADLCTGTEKSGEAEDFRCPSASSDQALWTEGGQTAGESQTGGPNGEYLVFSTYAQLTSEDSNAARDVYRYDGLTGVLARVSHGEGGYEPNGGALGSSIAQDHSTGSVFELQEMDVRATSEDGSRIVFTSAESLSSADTNGLVNAYEWHEGSVSLVSTGSDQEAVDDVVVSPDGSSVAFVTAQGLVPQDTDGLADVYVARTGSGFAPAVAERQSCEGDACQGPLTSPAALLVPGSVSQTAGQNVAAHMTVRAKAKRKAKCRRGNVRNKHGKCVKRHRRARGVGNVKSSRGGRS